MAVESFLKECGAWESVALGAAVETLLEGARVVDASGKLRSSATSQRRRMAGGGLSVVSRDLTRASC